MKSETKLEVKVVRHILVYKKTRTKVVQRIINSKYQFKEEDKESAMTLVYQNTNISHQFFDLTKNLCEFTALEHKFKR